MAIITWGPGYEVLTLARAPSHAEGASLEENQGKSELLQALRRVTDAMESEEFEVKDFQVDWSNGVQIVGVSNGILRRALTGDYTVKVRINLHNPAVHEKMLIALTGGK